MVPLRSLVASLLPLASVVSAWGTLGHDTVALIAQNFISAETTSFAQRILNDTSTTYLANVATWADSYRYTAAGKFSAAFHYIDAEDDPPHSCGVDLQRDCGTEGCVVSAIANYTTRATDTSLSAAQRFDALKFVIHFVGDIHQPLHDEALEVGGNTINVTFDSTITNLHHIWDSNIPEKLVGGYTMAFATSWSKNLTTAIKSGKYKSQAAGWLDGTTIDDASSTGMVWARDANTHVCSAVIPNGVAAVQNTDLGGTYYSGVISVVELQIAKAGYRLAAWLDLMATGKISRGGATTYSKRSVEPLSYLAPGVFNDFSHAKIARRQFGSICDHEH
ncbi:hypothetical protein EG328_001147 [Venturia inaequalis]|uniref:Nuclease S1 n=1 Tax=Venturia inaequalis TaxID=5025 RepID=A0A8H3Z361_VENIN|nr:hypothetical protein EG328_001147 [Venturia inaequalis]